MATAPDASDAPTFTVDFPPPLDLAASLEAFRRWGDDGLDRWDGQRLLRASRVGGRTVAWRAEIAGSRDLPRLVVRAQLGLPEIDRAALVAAIRATFVATPPDWPDLLARDQVVAALDAAHPGLRPYLIPDLFAGLVRGISAQLVNLTWAATTRRRLVEAFGDAHDVGGERVFSLSAERLASVPPERIRELQFTNAKARSIVGVAAAIADGRVDPVALAAAPDDDVIAALVALPGIGRWSAEWVLARTFGRARIVAGDLGVRKAVGRAYLGTNIASEADVRAATRHWGASAAVAQTLLLRTLVP